MGSDFEPDWKNSIENFQEKYLKTEMTVTPKEWFNNNWQYNIEDIILGTHGHAPYQWLCQAERGCSWYYTNELHYIGNI